MSLDAGTGGAKCFLIDVGTGKFYSSYHEWHYTFPDEAQPGGVEFSPKVFWKILVKVIHEILSKSGVPSDRIIAVSSTSQREGIVLLDKDGKELYGGPNIDFRFTAEINRIITPYLQELYRTSGHWPIPMFAPYRLLWFKQYKPELYERIDKVLMINDWILYKLSGVKFSEWTNAVETLLFDLKEKRWNKRLIQALNLNPDIFPPVKAPGTKIGEVTNEIAAITGLKAGTPVVTGGADTQCAMIGIGVVDPGQVGAVLGTFAPVMMPVKNPIIDQEYRTWSGCHLPPELWVIESSAVHSGSSIRWFRDTFFNLENSFLKNGPIDTYQYMDYLAAKSPLGSHGVYAFLGANIPNYRILQTTSGGFILTEMDMSRSLSKGDFIRAIYESIGFAIRGNIKRIERVTNINCIDLRITGGCSKSKILPQIIADVTGLPVSIPVCKESSSLGAAIAAGVGVGLYKDFREGIDKLVKWETTYKPSKDRKKEYDILYDRWLKWKDIIYGLKNSNGSKGGQNE